MTEQDASGRDQLNRALFSSLVSMLTTTALQQLGKLVNPLTNKTEINLEGAQVTIDMLSMIEAKTKGNLDPDEERMLKNTLATLQLNFVEVSEAAAARGSQEERGAGQPPSSESPDSSPAGEPTEKEADSKQTRFRKSYGTT